MRKIHALAIFGVALARALGCTAANEVYCDEQTPCTAGRRCDRERHVCVEAVAGLDARADSANAADAGDVGDGEPPDLSPPDGGSKLQNGMPCEASSWCDSDICKDGYCCASSCEGSCRSCAVAGREGSCELIPDGLDPDSECSGDDGCSGACDGEGGCRFPDARQSCEVDGCTSGALTTHSCDGSGACVAATQSCGGYACDAAGSACLASCTPGSGSDCTTDFTCIDGACANPQPLGAECGTNNAACASTYCVDGVCCAIAACPVCNACDENGAGTCAPVAGNPTCGDPTCTAAVRSTPTCSGGACQPVTQSCSPYQCDAAATGCRSSCDSEAHCVSGHYCDASKQCQQKKDLGESCGDALECQSGYCTEGVCCTSADCGGCKTCKPSGSCVAVADGVYPLFCSGDESCGARCEGGACAYEAPGVACAVASCDGPSGVITSFACDADHLCAGTPTSCGYYRCSGSPVACLTSCMSHGSCISGSACAITGDVAAGICTDPAKTSWVAPGVDPNTVLQPGFIVVLKPLNGPYDTITVDTPGSYVIIGWETAAMGGGFNKTEINATSPTDPAIRVTADSVHLYLQGLSLVGSRAGVISEGSGGTVHLSDCTIGNNTEYAVSVESGSLRVYRSEIGLNLAGGLWARGCSNTQVFDSVLFGNGDYTYVAPTSKKATGHGAIDVDCALMLFNVTAFDNIGSDYLEIAAGGVNWGGTGSCNIYNTIIWNNVEGSYLGECAFHNSTVEGPTVPSGPNNNNSDCSLDASGKPAAASACTNSGNNTFASELDKDRKPRIQSGTVDRGAWEIE